MNCVSVLKLKVMAVKSIRKSAVLSEQELDETSWGLLGCGRIPKFQRSMLLHNWLQVWL